MEEGTRPHPRGVSSCSAPLPCGALSGAAVGSPPRSLLIPAAAVGPSPESRLGPLWSPGPWWGRLRGPWRCAEPPLPTLLLPAPAEDGCAGSRGQVVSVFRDELSRGTLSLAMEPRGRCVLILSARSVPVGWDLFPISRLVVGFSGQQQGACSQDPGSGRWARWDSPPAPALVLCRCSVPGIGS